MLDLAKITNISVDGVNHKDHPEYCDAYILSADYNGKPMTESEIDDLNNNYGGFVYDSVINSIF